jgi:hypothetical protein
MPIFKQQRLVVAEPGKHGSATMLDGLKRESGYICRAFGPSGTSTVGAQALERVKDPQVCVVECR